jgi:hypothetical protein
METNGAGRNQRTLTRFRFGFWEKFVSEACLDEEQQMDAVSKMKHKSRMKISLCARLDRHRLYIRFDGFRYLRDENRSRRDIRHDKCSRPRNDIETVFN